MAATFGFPFTAAQWKELETQAMIYKYMVASVPVPYQLLLPIIQNIPNTPPTASATHSHHPLVRYSTKQDLEPGRCKRTDGKKWRCSRDVAPNQKYCERHMHRGRPRSRKHVEPSKNPTNPSTISNPLLAKNNNNPSPKVVGSTILPSATQPPFFLHNMQRDWSTEGGCEQQWRQIMQTSRSIFNNTNDFGVESALSFTDFATSHDDYLGSRRDFDEDKSKDSAGNLALDLSMAMANSNGFGEVSCGGPLAEVLPPSLSLVARYPTGDGDGDGRMTMLSDGSVCKSPTVAPSSTPTADIVAFQWFT